MRLTRVTNAQRQVGVLGGARARVIEGEGEVWETDVPAAGAVIGAGELADIVLADPAVSGRHVAVTPTERGFRVKDLGSRNGTFIDGVAIQDATVPYGTALRLGRSQIVLIPEEEAADIPPSEATSFGALVGGSLAMRQVFALLERASGSDAPVLLLGESGTGKELAARAVHEASPRAAGPFVVFDCGAASETLIASDLFGHVRGAFTGANADRVGAFAAADGGTLFLDEIGDLPLSLQPKLLRMLESGEVMPLGGRGAQRHDVRIVAATHRDLWHEVERGTFRGDLYYRLAVVEVHLPPLRRRADDIPSLVRVLLDRSGADIEGEVAGPNLERLVSHVWPGNVRELRNVVTRALALAPPGAAFDDLPIVVRPRPRGSDEPEVRADRPFHDVKAEVVERFERAYLADLLARSGGNLSEAARIAGLERKYLYRVLDRHDMRPRK